jgi:L-lactate dehydrogenase complex protein LldG
VVEGPVSARDEILARVSSAIAGAEAPEPPRMYRRALGGDREQLVALFCSRVADYRAKVHRIGAVEIPDTVAAICAGHSATQIGVPPGLPGAWRPCSVGLVEDYGLTPRYLDRLDGALTGCTAAVAETGTIVLTASAWDGRRALTLVPDLHICVVLERRISMLLPEAVARLVELGLAARPITFVSGPSATSDIELDRVEGVHGPRQLHVIVAKEPT